MPGTVWIVVVRSRTKDERDRCKESNRRNAAEHLDALVERIRDPRVDLVIDGDAGNILLFKQMVVDLSISHVDQLVDLRSGEWGSVVDNTIDGEFPWVKSDGDESGEEFEE